MTPEEEKSQGKASHVEGGPDSFIFKQMQQRQKGASNLPSFSMNAVLPQHTVQDFSSYFTKVSPEQGNVLHHLDSELANSHLEKYLPTPSIRYHVMRQRITLELEKIYAELNHYRQLPDESKQGKIAALEERVSLLQRKIFDLDQKLSRLNPFQSISKTLEQLGLKPFERTSKVSPRWTLIPNKRHQLREEMAEANERLESLHHMMETQLAESTFSPQAVGQLINRFDAELKKAEKLQAALRSQKGLTSKLNDKLQAWYRCFYENTKA